MVLAGTEDTEGDSLPDYSPPEPPSLWDVARRFAEDVKYRPFVGKYYGHFDLGKKEIALNTHDVLTFFHELAHAVHHQLMPGGLKGGQHAGQEVVAELAPAPCGAVRLPGLRLARLAVHQALRRT